METVRTVLNFLLICLEVVLIFNLLIVVHELGHFLAARWRGLVIEKFGIWFGKPLWKKTVNGVQYSLGTIPCGGFVALPQMAPMDAVEGESQTPRGQLPPISALDKIIVAAAGPLFSLGLAFVFAVIVWGIGRPVSEAENSTVIGYVAPDSPAAVAGLRAGDKILEVDGHKVDRFGGMTNSVVWYVVRSEGAEIPFKVQRKTQDGGSETLTFRPHPLQAESRSWLKRQSLRQVLIEPAYTPIVAKVEPGRAAAAAGLRPHDQILAVDGQELLGVTQFAEYQEAHPRQPLALTVQRGKEKLNLTLISTATPLSIDTVIKDSPAAAAGLKKGDAIVEFNGEKVSRRREVSERLKASKGQPVTLTIARQGATFQRTLTARLPEGGTDPLIGIIWDIGNDGLAWFDGGQTTLAHPGPFEQIRNSVSTVVNTIGAILSPRSDVKLQHLSGPPMILRTYYALFDSEYGWRQALWFSVILNVNLALLNMLPIPVLDGGHILLALIEAVRRKPVNIRILEFVQTACFIMIASYMLYVSFYDVVDSPFSRKRNVAEDTKFSPAPASSPSPANP
jgi:regulator of sigma E protease